MDTPIVRAAAVVLLSAAAALASYGQTPPPAGSAAASAHPRADALWEAARQGDAEAVSRELDAGVNVDTPFRYGATALSYACDRGHVEVVKVLLARGADVNVKDTFYGATPLSWAASPAHGEVDDRHVEIVALLLAKGAEGREQAVEAGVRSGHVGLVRVALAHGGPLDPELMSEALADAVAAKHEDIVRALEAAGVKPLPDATFPVTPAMLARYAGKYAVEGRDWTVEFTVVDGRLRLLIPGRPPVPLGAMDEVSFRSLEPGTRVTFESRDGAVVGARARASGQQFTLQRVGGAP